MTKEHRSPSGLGGVNQRANGRWVWQEDFGTDPVTGKRDRPTRERATREEVLEARDQVLASRQRQPKVPAPNPGSVADWLAEWLRHVSKDHAGNTYANYERACRNHIIPKLGELKLASLTTEDITKAFEGLPLPTRAMARKALSAAWTQAWLKNKVSDEGVVRRVLLAPPVEKVLALDTPEAAEAALLASLTPPVVQAKESMQARDQVRLMTYLETDRLRARWLLGCIYGERQSEVLGLCWPDLVIDAKGAFLVVRRSRVRQNWAHGCSPLAPCGKSNGKCPNRKWLTTYKSTKTPASVRRALIGPAMLAILEDWRARQALELAALDEPPEIPWMFTNTDGTPISHSSDRKAWEKVLKGAKMTRKYSLHHLRHTAASEAAANPAIDTPTFMAMFGWTRRSTAELYTHTRDDRYQAAWEGHQNRLLGLGQNEEHPDRD